MKMLKSQELYSLLRIDVSIECLSGMISQDQWLRRYREGLLFLSLYELQERVDSEDLSDRFANHFCNSVTNHINFRNTSHIFQNYNNFIAAHSRNSIIGYYISFAATVEPISASLSLSIIVLPPLINAKHPIIIANRYTLKNVSHKRLHKT